LKEQLTLNDQQKLLRKAANEARENVNRDEAAQKIHNRNLGIMLK